MHLIKPPRLKAGDKVATISLSWGGAGDPEILWRYEQGKQRLEEVFGLEVVEMPLTLKGSEYVYEHPKERARDLMQAFLDPSIKGIISCIGGNESIRMLPYIDFNVIRKYPKVFIGYSDTTVTHMICRKAGVSSFYGPAVLSEFAENVTMYDYTTHWIKKVLFNAEPIGEIPAAEGWTSEYLPWLIENKHTARQLNPSTGYEVLQGRGVHRGELIGGCMDTLEMLKGTEIWPSLEEWDGKLLFFETSEDKPSPLLFSCWLRNYAAQGILHRVSGLLFAKPYDEAYMEEYREAIIKIVRDEQKLTELPILFNLNFGHTAPMCIMPYGAEAEINCEAKSFTILESGVI